MINNVSEILFNSEIGTCCRSLVLPKRAASLAPKNIVVARGGEIPSYSASDDLQHINLFAK